MASLVIGLKDGDLTEWEQGFVADLRNRMSNDTLPVLLSPKQTEIVQRIHDKHFA